jgi:hypothetical protein
LQTDWRRASDHHVFNLEQIPYLYFGVDSHPYYHTVNDTVERIDRRFFQAAVETVYDFIKALDVSYSQFAAQQTITGGLNAEFTP